MLYKAPALAKILLCCLLLCQAAFAAEPAGAGQADVASPVLSFTVRPQLPRNQVDASAGYFYLMMEPGARQTLLIEILNDSADPVTVTVDAYTAYSNANGIIQYGPSPAQEEDLSPQYQFSDLATVLASTITVEPHDAAVASVILQMPEEPYEGTLLGGLAIRQVREDHTPVSSMGIVSLFQYIVGVRLVESDAAVAPEFSLETVEVRRDALANQSLVFTLRNPKALVAKPLSISVSIAAMDRPGVPLYSDDNEMASMAPNSTMHYTRYPAKALPAGEYVATVALTLDGETYTLESSFTVMEKE